MISLKAKRRLTKLANYLETIDPDAFDMGTWGYDDNLNDRGAEEEDHGRAFIMPEGACLTVGCAMGHACSIPSFRRLGLHMVYNYGFEPRFGGESGFNAAARFFDISMDAAYRLFEAHNYDWDDRREPRAVAARLRSFVKTGE